MNYCLFPIPRNVKSRPCNYTNYFISTDSPITIFVIQVPYPITRLLVTDETNISTTIKGFVKIIVLLNDCVDKEHRQDIKSNRLRP